MLRACSFICLVAFAYACGGRACLPERCACDDGSPGERACDTEGVPGPCLCAPSDGGAGPDAEPRDAEIDRVDGGQDAAAASAFVSIDTDMTTGCAVRADGSVVCWGEGLGPRPARIDGIEDATEVGVGGAHVCVVRATGSLVCWGQNAVGQLGNGTTVASSSPAPVASLGDAIGVSAGAEHTCALRASGMVSCWGAGGLGQLGDGSTGSPTRPAPADVVGISDALAVESGALHSCALLAGGEARCWGRNAEGQLGDGGSAASGAPVSVAGLTGAATLASGPANNCVARDDGTAFCWGEGAASQAGVSAIASAVEVVAGFWHACARLASGEVRCWGRNYAGQLGNGSFEDSARTPVEVVGLTDAVDLSAGLDHTCAIRASGGIVCWGRNDRGQLGDGTVAVRTRPVAVLAP